MKFKNFLTIFILIFVSSCSSGNENIVKTSSLIPYENSNFSLNIPSNWSILTWTSWVLPEPKNGEISLAVSSSELKYGFSNNLLILRQNLQKVITSRDFSILNNVWSTKEYLEYLKIEAKTITFADNDKSYLYIFEAKYNTNTPKLKFLQVWKVCSVKNGYLLTIAISTDIKDTSAYEEILKSFRCK